MKSTSIDSSSQSSIPAGFLELVQESRQQVKILQRELSEIKVLVKQCSSEVENLGGRATEASKKLRELEANMDQFSRQEIRSAFTSAQEAEMRLFVMKGQLEMLEHKQSNLERLRSLLQAVIDIGASAGAEDQIPSERESVELEPLRPSANGEPIIPQIMQAQENERQRLARQLHDGPAQTLTNLILRAEICHRMLDHDLEEARSEMAGLRGMIVNSLQETRGFIFDLRPMILDDLGLIPTLRRQADILTSRTRTPIRLTVQGSEHRLPSQTEVVVFRAVQEVLDNAVKHGKASEIRVSIEIGEESTIVVVEDNGVGFDINKVMALARQKKALAFRGVQEQVASIKGQMSFETSIGHGSKVTIKAPV